MTAETVFLGQWCPLVTASDNVRDELQSFIGTHANYVQIHPDTVNALTTQVVDTFAALWQVTGQDADANKAVVAGVNGLKTKFSELLNDPLLAGMTEVRGIGARFAADSIDVDALMLTDAADLAITSDWKSATSAATYAAQIQKHDRALGWLSYTLAVLTGLSTLYFGQNFGTVGDYVKLILWAFGAKITVDVLSGGLERWVGYQSH